ncbi:TPA: replication protein RepA [Escherichia coli]|nr:RepA [Salmonella enterica]EKD5436189.1 replication initiator protein A [Salmonella enterica subsp. enterica serovar Montevideo]
MKPKHDSKGAGALSGLSQRHRQLIEDFWAIEQESAVKAGSLGCMTRILAQATLPHTDPSLPPGTMYSRSTGQLTLNITPTTRKYGVPFGTIPRIVLAWICTEAARTKNRTLILGKSQREFLEKIQLHSNGRDIARMREQCMRLFRAVVSVEYENDQVEQSQRLPITNSDTIFWHKSPDVQSLWNSELELTEEFFKEVLAHPVPLDLRVFHSLSKSPLAMDIYTWLTYRMFVIAATGQRIVRVPWLGLKAQLGSNIADTPEGLRLFKSRFKQRLAEVLLFYPEARSHISDEGTYLKLTPCKLHLTPSELRKALR